MRAKMIVIDALELGARNMFDEMSERSRELERWKRGAEMETTFL